MSKKHGHKAKRKAKVKRRAVCADCREPLRTEPWGLLASLAVALNACAEAGLKPTLTGWQSIHTRQGYVLKLNGKREWAARTVDYEPFPGVAPDDLGDVDGMDS